MKRTREFGRSAESEAAISGPLMPGMTMSVNPAPKVKGSLGSGRLRATPDRATLRSRRSNVDSRGPAL